MTRTREAPTSGQGQPAETFDEAGPVSAVSLDALAVRVGHAVNNPLGALLANLDLAVERLRAAGQEPAARIEEAILLLAEARLAGERIHTVVGRLGSPSAPTEAPPPPRDTALSVEEPATSSHRKVRVLIVDDDAMVGNSLRRSLRDYDVVLLDNAKGALARVAAGERFDVLFCDLMMPEMTGMDLHEEVLRVAPDQAERMVFLTGGAVTTRARDFVEAVPNLVLDKPFDVQRLREIVRSRAQ